MDESMFSPQSQSSGESKEDYQNPPSQQQVDISTVGNNQLTDPLVNESFLGEQEIRYGADYDAGQQVETVLSNLRTRDELSLDLSPFGTGNTQNIFCCDMLSEEDEIVSVLVYDVPPKEGYYFFQDRSSLGEYCSFGFYLMDQRGQPNQNVFLIFPFRSMKSGIAWSFVLATSNQVLGSNDDDGMEVMEEVQEPIVKRMRIDEVLGAVENGENSNAMEAGESSRAMQAAEDRGESVAPARESLASQNGSLTKYLIKTVGQFNRLEQDITDARLRAKCLDKFKRLGGTALDNYVTIRMNKLIPKPADCGLQVLDWITILEGFMELRLKQVVQETIKCALQNVPEEKISEAIQSWLTKRIKALKAKVL